MIGLIKGNNFFRTYCNTGNDNVDVREVQTNKLTNQQFKYLSSGTSDTEKITLQERVKN